MALIDPAIGEMPDDLTIGAMPYYPQLLAWITAEVDGLTDEQLDFDDDHPDREWMWWSIRRQVSHIGWDSLVLPYRRCAELLWPDGERPSPIDWDDHRMGPQNKWDRVLDEDRYWAMPDLLAKVELGLSWLERVVTEQSIETLRAKTKSVWGTHFWAYVITTLPRGAAPDPAKPGSIMYDLEGSLWMVYYEMLSHIRTIQRLKLAQGLDPAVELPRVGYLRLPEFWGDTDTNGPPLTAL